MTYGCVIASYGYGHLAAHCLETVLEQSKPFDEVHIVDDGVGDCFHLPKLYKMEYPKLHMTARVDNFGTVKNFQDILQNHVYTDMVMFLGADNWLRPDTLEILAQEQKEAGTDIIVFDGVVVGTEKEWAVRNFNSKSYEGG